MKIETRLYNYSAGGYCGVLMPENVMKKLAKLNHEYSSEVKKVLHDHKQELHTAHWTCANHRVDGEIKKQIIVHFTIANNDELDRRISLFKASQPEYIKTVYMVGKYEEAYEIAETVLAEELSKEQT